MYSSTATLAAPSRSRVWGSLAMAAMLLLSMFSAVIGVRTASAQDAQHDLASVVPADAPIFMSVNLDQDSAQWTLFYSLMERAGLNEVAEAETGVSTEEIGQMAEAQNFTGTVGLVFTDADALVSFSSTGVMETATSAMDTMDVDPDMISEEVPNGFAIVFQPEDPAAVSEQMMTVVTDEASYEGAEVQTVDYNGVTITYWEPAEEGRLGSAVAEVDGTVIFAPRTTDIEPIIDTAQGKFENLADTDGFANVSSKLTTEYLAFGYINLDVLMGAVEADPTYAELFTEEAGMTGMDSASGHAGFVAYASDAGLHLDSVMIPNDASMIPDASVVPGMADKLPADIMLAYMSNDLYSTGIADVLGVVMQTALAESSSTDGDAGTSATPASTPTLEDTWAVFEAQIGFNPDTDLLAKLDGEYAVSAGVYDLESGFPNPEFLFVSGTSDAATLQSTTDTITSLVENMNEGEYEVSTRTVDGGELTVITLSEETTGGIPVVIEYGVVNDEMLIGMNGAIDRYLDPAGDRLADDANYQKTMDLLPSENVVSVSYVNIEGQVMPLLDWMAVMLGSSMNTLDNHEDCGNYATQVEAQAAYDDDPGNLWLLDMDYDGEACEDFFGTSTPAASPEAISEQVNIVSAATVNWVDDDAVYSSSILVIGD